MAGEFIPDPAPGQFVPDAPPRSALGEVGAAAARGLFRGVQGAGAVLQAPAEQAHQEPGLISGAGTWLEKYGKEHAANYEAQPETHGPVTNFASQVAEAPGSALPLLAGAYGGAAAGSVVAPGVGSVVGGAVGGAAAAGEQTWHEKYHEGLESGMADDKARDYAASSGTAQAALMGAAGGAGGAVLKGGGIISKAAGFGARGAAAAGGAAIGKKFIPEFAKGGAELGAVNVGLGVGGAAAQAKIDQDAGLQTQNPMEAAIAAIPGSIGGAIGFLPFAALGAHTNVKHAKETAKALADPANPNRAAAVRSVYDAMEKANPDEANTWAFNAGEALHAGKPIGVSTDWTTGPHPSVFPEAAKALEGPKPIIAGAPGADEGPTGPTDAEQANTALWARRAEHDRLAAGGPLGRAAAVGMDSGAVDQKAAERQSELDSSQTTTDATKPAEPSGNPVQDQAQENIRLFTRNTPGLPLAEAQRKALAVDEDGAYKYQVVPHPSGGGYAIVPDHFITPELAEQYAGLQRGGKLPSPESRVPGRMVGSDTAGVPPESPRYGDLPPADTGERAKLMPFATPEAAQNRADALTTRTGNEHEVIPHPYARDKYAVQEKPLSTENGQTQGDEHAISEQSSAGLGAHPGGDEGAGRDVEGSGVGRGEQGQETTRQSQATGETRNLEEWLHPDAVARSYGVTFKEPTETAGRNQKHTGRAWSEPDESGRAEIGNLLNATEAAGHNTAMFDGANFATYEGGSGDGPASALLKSRTIGIRADILRGLAAGTQSVAKVVGWIRHEGWHLLDLKNRDGELRSSEHPAFDVKTNADGSREAVGGIMKEAFDAFSSPDTKTSETLDYPFRSMWDGKAADHGFNSEEHMSQIIRNELFAQLGRMHDEHPDWMKAELPKAYDLFERIKHGTESGDTGDAARRAVHEALRATGADGSHTESVEGRGEPTHPAGVGRGETGIRMVRDASEQPDSERAARERGQASLDDFKPGNLSKLLKKKNWAVLTAENPKAKALPDELNAARNARLKSDLNKLGVSYKEVIGRYGAPKDEHSFVVTGITQEQALQLRDKYGQDSVLTRQGLEHADGSITPAKDVTEHTTAPEDYYTKMPDGTMFTANLDFDKRTAATVLPPEIAKHLTADELKLVGAGRNRVGRLKEIFEKMPDSRYFEAAAKAGGAAKEWYARSFAAIQGAYGKDTRRFMALMAALSPQTNVKGNFYNAARTFAAWEKSGRTNDPAKLAKIFNANLLTDLGREEGKKAMTAWTMNGTRVLTATDPMTIRLSGPKVSSFMQNLLGHGGEVTNDRHMADFAGIDQALLGGVKTKDSMLGQKSPGYMALSARVRQAAAKLGWTPAETQASIWSWWNSLKKLSKDTGKSALQLIRDGDLTTERIRQEPHLGSYLHEEAYRAIDEDRGQRAGRLDDGERGESGAPGPSASEEGGRSAPSRADESNARRLDKLKETRLAEEQARADSKLAGKSGDDIVHFVHDKEDRQEPKPPFYSGMDRAIAEKAPFAKDGTISAQMLRNWLEQRTKDGPVKRDELNWTGLDDYLKLQEGKVTRDQVQKFLDHNGVKVEEHLLSTERSSEDFDGLVSNAIHDGMTREQAEDFAQELMKEKPEAKYADRVLPGGKNYHELLLTLPTKESRNVANQIPPSQKDLNATFKSAHFDQPNILAHVRFNERTDANGKKVLFIEELQSDWAQKGRKEGIKGGAEQSFDALKAKIEQKYGMSLVDLRQSSRSEEKMRDLDAIDQAYREAQQEKHGSKVPSAPFVGKTEAWTALALKRMIRYAAENGFDRVAWTTGEQQNARYPGGGDERAAKQASGMQTFYDKIVPNVANDVLKKLGGGKVDVSGIKTGNAPDDMVAKHPNNEPFQKANAPQPQQGFDITPQMKSKVMEGQPLFVRDKDDRQVPAKDLAPKATGGKAAEAEQQFTKSGEPVKPVADKNKPDWVAKASPEAQAFLKKAGVYVEQKSWGEKWKDLKHEMGLKIITGTLDQYRPVLDKISRYSYQLLRMASASDNGLAALVQNGHVYMNKWGALAVKEGTKSLKQIMAPLAGEHERFLAWMAANRADMLMKEGREHNFTAEEIAAGKKLNTEMHADDKFKGEGSRAMAYAHAKNEFSAMNKSVLDVAEAAGIIDPEARKVFEHDFYVNFRREEKGEPAFDAANVSGMVNAKGIKRLKGGDDELHDLMANTMNNWSGLLASSMKNNAAWHTLEEAETLGIAHRSKADAEGSMYVLQGGKQIHFVVDDPLVSQAISSLGAVPMRGPIMKGLGMMKHALTVGTTWSPVFRIRHTVREQITALAANPTGYNPVKNWIDGFQYSSKNNPEYGNMAAGGAFFHMGLDLEGNRAAFVKRLIAHEVDPKTLVDSPHRALQMLGHMADWWKETGERSDSITRANLYRQTFARMVAEGHDPERAHFEASYIARDAMDYSLHGSNAAIRMVSQIVPFFNARAQGLYKLGRGAADNPKRFAAVVGGITLATMALSLAQRDDKDVQNASEWDRDNNWLIKIGNVMYRVPKPFEVGALATVADRALEVALNGFQPTDRERFAARLFPILGQQLSLNPIPQAVFPALELWANKDVFKGTHIEAGRDEKLSTAERIGPNTSVAAQLLGKAGVLSPEQIDFAVGAYLGWVGTHVVNTVDLALRSTGSFPTKAAPRLDDFFLIGDFAHQLPANQSRFVEQYYTHMQKIQEAFGDLRMLQQTGQMEKAAEQLKDKKQDIQLNAAYLRTQREIGVLNRRQRYVNMSNMSADDKRTELDRLSQVKNSLATIAEKTRATAVDRPQ